MLDLGPGLAGEVLALALDDAVKLLYINSNIQLLGLIMTAHHWVTDQWLVTIVREIASTWELRKCWFIRCALSGTGSTAATCGLGIDTCGLVNITITHHIPVTLSLITTRVVCKFDCLHDGLFGRAAWWGIATSLWRKRCNMKHGDERHWIRCECSFMFNSHRPTRRDKTVEFRRVG